MAQFLAIRTLRRMFSYIEFPRALGSCADVRSEALVTRTIQLTESLGELDKAAGMSGANELKRQL